MDKSIGKWVKAINRHFAEEESIWPIIYMKRESQQEKCKSYHKIPFYTHLIRKKIKKSDIRMWIKGNFTHGRGIQLLWKIILWHCFMKLNLHRPYDPVILLVHVYSRACILNGEDTTPKGVKLVLRRVGNGEKKSYSFYI